MILDDIMAHKRVELAESKRATSLAELQERPLFRLPRRSLPAALASRSRAVIAEVKKASPSKGLIRADFDPVAIAREYATHGAAAISVLTEVRFFQGSLDYLAAVRAAVDVPLLRKDFLFDPYQVYEARAYGADAILLIVAVLDDDSLRSLLALATELSLASLVEVHDREEMARAQRAGASLIGINNRDLRTFVTTLATSEALAGSAPPDAMLVAESGIHTGEDIARLERAGVRSFLIGEALMRAASPGKRLAELLARPGE